MQQKGVVNSSPKPEQRGLEDQVRARLRAMRDDFGRRHALVDGATVCEDALTIFEEYLRARDEVCVTPAEAASISGFHPEHITRLVRQGRIPDLRPRGSRGRIRIPLSALPRKPGHVTTDMSKINDLAERMFGQRKKR